MKTDFSNWQHKPENPTILKAYVESVIVEGLIGDIVPKVVWRDDQLTVTLQPQEGEAILDYTFTDHRPKEKPDFSKIFKPIPDEEEE
jgi:phage tail sheath protein FI